MSKQFLQVDGAKICYEVEGKGPYIFLVPGANGSGDLFIPLRDILIKYFTIVIYYRRGYCDSELSVPQDYTKKLENDAEDLYTLSRSITNEKIIVFSISYSGAVLMRYLIKYPETILKLFLHEPFMNIKALPEKEELQKFHYDGYRLYRKKGKRAAIEELTKRYFCENDRTLMTYREIPEIIDSTDYFFEHEFKVYPFLDIELEKVEAQKDKLVLLHGVESINYFIYQMGASVSKYLRIEYLPFPGGHAGFFTKPNQFAADFIKLCQKHLLIKDQAKI
ncbi:hypothetical protein HPULCUR_002906 [Helicostylum pulchrum]|uniref:AB hydrolase-1 domain-containing protein n=1 Tax=Helicostylum pulchrum TaxID=562976 RepID=A0ABP9XRW9_9FUNG